MKKRKARTLRSSGTATQRAFGQEGQEPQASIAIGLSAARKRGARVPKKKKIS